MTRYIEIGLGITFGFFLAFIVLINLIVKLGHYFGCTL